MFCFGHIEKIVLKLVFFVLNTVFWLLYVSVVNTVFWLLYVIIAIFFLINLGQNLLTSGFYICKGWIFFFCLLLQTANKRDKVTKLEQSEFINSVKNLSLLRLFQIFQCCLKFQNFTTSILDISIIFQCCLIFKVGLNWI